MIRNYLNSAIRNLRRHKLFSFINILGLSISLGVSILLFLFVYHEYTFDKYHENYNDIYRITSEVSINGGQEMSAPTTFGRTSEQIYEKIPGIINSTRLLDRGIAECEYEGQHYSNIRNFYVDSSFFRVFTVNIISGDPFEAFKNTQNIAITVSLAQKIWASKNVIGNILLVDGRDCKISAVLGDPPSNSHPAYDMLSSMPTLDNSNYRVVEREGMSFYTYFTISPESNVKNINRQVKDVCESIKELSFGEMGLKLKTEIQALKDIHLYSEYGYEIANTGDINQLLIFSLLALLVLVIAIINFINLVTARSETRAREIGIRKVSGAKRRQLIFQFLGESILMSYLSFIIALAIVELVYKDFGELLNRELEIFYHTQLLAAVLLALFPAIIGIIAGIYPSFFLSSYRPINVLKGKISKKRNGFALRKILVIIQFSIAVFLMISLGIMQSQLHYFNSKSPGFHKDNILVIHNLNSSIKESWDEIREELSGLPEVINITASQSIPGKARSIQNTYKLGDNSTNGIIIYENRVRNEYINTYKIEIKEGRDFDPKLITDRKNFIINESAQKKLGLEKPLGEKIIVYNDTGSIIGVVKDFSFFSLKSAVEPLVFTHKERYINYISVRFNGHADKAFLKKTEEVFHKTDPSYIFDYFFLDESLQTMYYDEKQSAKMISWATLLSITISMLGLLALTAFTIQKKFREIGLRKALGASVRSINFLLLKDLLIWVGIANIIAYPAAYLIMKQWLTNFYYHISPGPCIFIMATLISSLVAILTSVFLTLKAANMNPAIILRHE